MTLIVAWGQDFADALLNIADQSVVSEGTALKAQVDAAFESAEKAYGWVPLSV